MRPALRVLALSSALALCGAGCLSFSPTGPSFASEPPGARVRIDGRDSGWVTPCQIALDTADAHHVTLELSGYTPRDFLLLPERRHSAVTWPLGVNGVNSTVRFPLLLPFEDFLFPFRTVEAFAPGRIFVRLRPEADS